MSATTLEPALVAVSDPIVGMLECLNEGEERFNVYAALLKYGRHFRQTDRYPTDLKGQGGECFKTCTKAILPIVFDPEPSYFYAEGYALDPEMGVPLEHAWLVETTGRAIDLPWQKNENVLYFGVTIKPAFLLEACVEPRSTAFCSTPAFSATSSPTTPPSRLPSAGQVSRAGPVARSHDAG